MSRLLIITQAVDPQDSDLGFFCDWLKEFADDSRASEIEVWCLRTGEWMEKPDKITIFVLPKSGRLFAFLSRLVRSRFDAVFVHMSPLWVVLGGWWWRMTGQRVVLWYTHGTGSMMLRAAIIFANQVLTATKEAFPIKSRKVSAIGHGIGPAFASVPRPARAGELAILGSGRITPRKRVIETLGLFAEMLKLNPNLKFTWVGEPQTDSDSEYLLKAKEEIKRLKLENRVTLKGKVAFADLPAVYAKSDLLLHLSATGSLDKVVIEALASGCSVFSTNPATGEVIPSAYWNGPELHAAAEALRRAEQGIASDMRGQVGKQFSLHALMGRILDTCFLG